MAVAIAAAVVGPPTFALLARYNSLDWSLKINFPILIKNPKCIAICNAENKNRVGADFNTSPILPAAPEAAKNICMKIIPMAVPVDRILWKKRGNNVAPKTVTIDINGKACIVEEKEKKHVNPNEILQFI